MAAEEPADSVARSMSGFGNAIGITYSAPGSDNDRSNQLTSRPEPAAADQHETVDELRMLIGELHRHAAAERVPDDRDARRRRARRGSRAVRWRTRRASSRPSVWPTRRGRGGRARSRRSRSASAGITASHVRGVPGQPVDEQHDLAWLRLRRRRTRLAGAAVTERRDRGWSRAATARIASRSQYGGATIERS